MGDYLIWVKSKGDCLNENFTIKNDLTNAVVLLNDL